MDGTDGLRYHASILLYAEDKLPAPIVCIRHSESLDTDSSSFSSFAGTELCANKASMAANSAGVKYPNAPCGLCWL